MHTHLLQWLQQPALYILHHTLVPRSFTELLAQLHPNLIPKIGTHFLLACSCGSSIALWAMPAVEKVFCIRSCR